MGRADAVDLEEASEELALGLVHEPEEADGVLGLPVVDEHAHFGAEGERTRGPEAGLEQKADPPDVDDQ